MIGPSDEELLQGALDGTLSAEETERLHTRLASDPALRARAESLNRLASLVNASGQLQPPKEFTDRVMAAVATVSSARAAWHRRLASVAGAIGHQLFPGFAHHSERSTGHPEFVRKAGMAGGGVIVAKKALWGIAGLAVIVILGVVYFNGTRSVDQGAQGTIGGADRYRGAQPSSVNVKAGDAQEFLQSDTFDRLVKDKNVRSLLGNHEFCALLADADVAAALGHKALQVALADDAVQAALGHKALQTALADADVQAALKSLNLQQALLNGNTRNLLSQLNIQAALNHVDLIQQALHGNDRALAGYPDFEAALKQNALFKQLVGDDAFQAALKSSSLKVNALMADDAFQAALKTSALKFNALMADDAFQAALKHSSLQVAQLMGDADFQAALKNSQLLSALQARGMHAALMDSAAMDAALNQRAMQQRQ